MIDPVCGMTVDPASAAGSHAHAGQTYYFCSRHCLELFAADPSRFHRPGAATGRRAARRAGGQWTCPMHPGDRARRAGRLPDLRHGAGAARRGADAAETANPELAT